MVRPTRLRLLLLITVTCGVLGWVVATMADSILTRYLPVPVSAALAMWLLAVMLGMWILLVRPRLLRRPGTLPLPPEVAARTAALALAVSRVGAGVAGFYAGVGLVFVLDLPIPAAQSGAWLSLATLLGGVTIAALALWLEALCRIRDDDDESGEVSTGSDLRGIAGGPAAADRTSA